MDSKDQVDREEDSFQKRLSPLTSKYLASKTKILTQDQSLDKIDLRDMCDEVIHELEKLEDETAYEYLKVETDANILTKQIKETDAIMFELESILNGFQDQLGTIKNEMTFLQEKSLTMNFSLLNRRNLQRNLERFIDSVFLEPQLIFDICNRPVDDKYIDLIKELNSKLEYIKANNLEKSNTVRELDPELSKLKARACEKIKIFITGQLELLKKPKTNIQFTQNNILIKYNVFMEFLRANYIHVFIDILNMYFELMGKLMFTQIKLYTQEVTKLWLDIYNKNDYLISENPSSIRAKLSARPEGLNFDDRTIFSSMDREKILDSMDEPPILTHVASQKNQRFLLEAVFKAVNKVVIESVNAEYRFVTDFFSLEADKTKQVFGKIFDSTFNYLVKHFEDLAESCNDLFSLLIIALINLQNRKLFEYKGFTILEFYFDQMSQKVWPKFEKLFDLQISSIKAVSIRSFKQVEKTHGLKLILLRYIDFTLTLYKILSKQPENSMVKTRIVQAKTAMLDLLKKSAKESPNELESTSYIVSSIDFILSQLSQQSGIVYQDDMVGLEKELGMCIDRMVDLALGENFANLVDFVKKYAPQDGAKSDQIQSSEITFSTSQDKMKKEAERQQIIKLIENVSVEFSELWAKKVDNIKEKYAKIFGIGNTFKQIIRKLLSILLAYYTTFYNYVKQNFIAYTSSLVALHVIMKQIDNYKKSLM